MRRRRVLAALWLVLGVSVACGPRLPPQTSPEARIAVRADQVIAGLRAVLPGIKALVCDPAAPVAPCVKASDAVVVVAAIERAGTLTRTELAPALSAVDAARDAASHTAGMARVRAVLASIQQSLSAAQIAPESEAARAALVGLLAGVQAALFAAAAF